MSNSVNPDEMPHSVGSDLSLHFLLKPFCPNNILGKYSKF